MRKLSCILLAILIIGYKPIFCQELTPGKLIELPSHLSFNGEYILVTYVEKSTDTRAYIVGELISFEQFEYKSIYSIPLYNTIPMQFSDNVFPYIQDTDSSRILYAADMDSSSPPCSLLIAKSGDNILSWLYESDYFQVNLRDSIIAYTDYDYNTIVRYLCKSRNYDVIKSIDNAYHQYFSGDGNAVFMINNYLDTDSSMVGEVWTYNILLDSLYLHVKSNGIIESPRGISSDSDVYYIKKILDSGEANIWRYNIKAGEAQITFHEPPFYVYGYEITAKGIFYFINDKSLKLPNVRLTPMFINY